MWYPLLKNVMLFANAFNLALFKHMTKVLITVDTELSARLFQDGADVRANVEQSILCRCPAGQFGIGWQMDVLDAHQLTGVFFVDPMPALVYGEAFLQGIVGPIVARGHEVQLHIHTEWLEWAPDSPVDGRQGRNIGDFSLADQIVLLGLARDLLVKAGAPLPTAFRAGNYGANDDSLTALTQLGLLWDTSFNAGYLGNPCAISLAADQVAPAPHRGLTEVPVSGLYAGAKQFRAAQICALSASEMKAAMDHAAAQDHPFFTIVTHSFEMMTRDRRRPNPTVMGRFKSLCRAIADNPELSSSGFTGLDPKIGATQWPDLAHFQSNRIRTAARMAEQLYANIIHERQINPA
jgi:peptidoglycan/xylan/chitin deacetylase (PgdA/CDA1 family)